MYKNYFFILASYTNTEAIRTCLTLIHKAQAIKIWENRLYKENNIVTKHRNGKKELPNGSQISICYLEYTLQIPTHRGPRHFTSTSLFLG